MRDIGDKLWGHSFDKPKITPKRLVVLRRNISDIIEILYAKGEAGLFDIDMGLRNIHPKKGKNRFPYIELGVGASLMLEYLQNIGILEKKKYPYRLKEEYRSLLAT